MVLLPGCACCGGGSIPSCSNCERTLDWQVSTISPANTVPGTTVGVNGSYAEGNSTDGAWGLVHVGCNVSTATLFSAIATKNVVFHAVYDSRCVNPDGSTYLDRIYKSRLYQHAEASWNIRCVAAGAAKAIALSVSYAYGVKTNTSQNWSGSDVSISPAAATPCDAPGLTSEGTVLRGEWTRTKTLTSYQLLSECAANVLTLGGVYENGVYLPGERVDVTMTTETVTVSFTTASGSQSRIAVNLPTGSLTSSCAKRLFPDASWISVTGPESDSIFSLPALPTLQWRAVQF